MISRHYMPPHRPIEPRRCEFCLPLELIRQSVIETGKQHSTTRPRRPSDPELVNLLKQAVSGLHGVGQPRRGDKDGEAKSPP